MTAEHEAAPQSPTAEPPRGDATAPSFARLAKKISAWTSRGIVSAAILVAGLAFGRQVLQWWGVERDPLGTPHGQSLALGSLGDPAQEHLLEFGDSRWRMSRRTVSARAAGIVGQVESRCAELIPSCRAPEGEPGPAERDLLGRIAQTKPAREEAGQWQLFTLDATLPIVLGTRWAGETGVPPKERVAKPRWRVVTWGLAVPAGGDTWTIYTFHTASPGGGSAAAVSDLPIPPGGRRTLAIRAADGGAVMAFRGPNRLGRWEEFYSAWLSANGWRVAEDWRRGDGVSSVRAVGASGDTLDVLLTSHGTDEMTGVALVTPREPGSNQPAAGRDSSVPREQDIPAAR